MKKSILSIAGLVMVATMLIGGGRTVYARMTYNAFESNNVGYSQVTNTCTNTRYFENTIFKTTKRTNTGGTALVSKSGTLTSGATNQVKASLSGVSHAYGMGSIFKGSPYESGSEFMAKVIIK